MSDCKNSFGFGGKAKHIECKEKTTHFLKKAFDENRKGELNNWTNMQNSSGLQALLGYGLESQNSPLSENLEWDHTQKGLVVNNTAKEYPHQNESFLSMRMDNCAKMSQPLKSILKVKKTGSEYESTSHNWQCSFDSSEITLPFSLDNIENEDEFLYGESIEEPIVKQQTENTNVKGNDNWSDDDDFLEHHSSSQNRNGSYAGKNSQYFKTSLNNLAVQKGNKTEIPNKGLLDGITIDIDLQPDSWNNPSDWDEPLSPSRKTLSPVLDIFQENVNTWRYISEWKNSSFSLKQSNSQAFENAGITPEKSVDLHCNTVEKSRMQIMPPKIASSHDSVSKVKKVKIDATCDTVKSGTTKSDVSKPIVANDGDLDCLQAFDPCSPSFLPLPSSLSALLQYSKLEQKQLEESVPSKKKIRDSKIESNIYQHNEDNNESTSPNVDFKPLIKNSSVEQFQCEDQKSFENTARCQGNKTAEPLKMKSDTHSITLKLLPHPVQKLKKHSTLGTSTDKTKAIIKGEAKYTLEKEKQIDSIEKYFESKTKDEDGNTNISNLQSIFEFLDKNIDESCKTVKETSLMPHKRTVYCESESSAHSRTCNSNKKDSNKFNKISVRTTNLKKGSPVRRVVQVKPRRDQPFGGEKYLTKTSQNSARFLKKSCGFSFGEHRNKRGRYSRQGMHTVNREMCGKRPKHIDQNSSGKSIHFKSSLNNVHCKSPNCHEFDKERGISCDLIPQQGKLHCNQDGQNAHTDSMRVEYADNRSSVLHPHDRSSVLYTHDRSPGCSFEASPYRLHTKSPERHEGSPRRTFNSRNPGKYPRDRSPRKYSRDWSPGRRSCERNPRRYSYDRSPGRHEKNSWKYDRSPSNISSGQSHKRVSSDGSRVDEVILQSPKAVEPAGRLTQNPTDKVNKKTCKKDVNKELLNQKIPPKHNSEMSKDQTLSLKGKDECKEITVDSKSGDIDDSDTAVLNKMVVPRISRTENIIIDNTPNSQSSQLAISDELPTQSVQQTDIFPTSYSAAYQQSFYDQRTSQPVTYCHEEISPGYYPNCSQSYNFYPQQYSSEVSQLALPPSSFDYSQFYSVANSHHNEYPDPVMAYAKSSSKPNKVSNNRILTSVPLQETINSCKSIPVNTSMGSVSLNVENTQSCLSAERYKELVSRKASVRIQVANLNSEFSQLCKFQGEYIRKKSRENDGHKDKLIHNYSLLQDEIKKKLQSLVDEAKAIEKELQKPVKEFASTLNDPVEPTALLKQSEVKKKEAGDNALDSECKSKGIEYYDPGSHWCKLCNKLLLTLPALLEHLHSSDHKQHLDSMDRPWATEYDKPKKKLLKQQELNVCAMKGGQFLIPIEGFYCSLCKQMFGDKTCANDHLLSHDHNQAYEKYTSENPIYERRWILDRLAGLAIMNKEEKKRKADVERLLLNKHKKKEEEKLVNKLKEMPESKTKFDEKKTEEITLVDENTSSRQEKKGIRLVLLDGKNPKITEKSKENVEKIKTKQKFVYIGRAPNYKPRATLKLDSKAKEEDINKEIDLRKKCLKDFSIPNGNVADETPVSVITNSPINVTSTNQQVSSPHIGTAFKANDSSTNSVSFVTNSNYASCTSQLPETPHDLFHKAVSNEMVLKAEKLFNQASNCLVVSKVVTPHNAFISEDNITKSEGSITNGSDACSLNKSENNTANGAPFSNINKPSKCIDLRKVSENSSSKGRTEKTVKNPKGRYNSVLIPVTSKPLKNDIMVVSSGTSKKSDASVVESKATKPAADHILPSLKAKNQGQVHGPLTEEEEDFLLLGIDKEDMKPLVIPKPPPSSLLRQYATSVRLETPQKTAPCEELLSCKLTVTSGSLVDEQISMAYVTKLPEEKEDSVEGNNEDHDKKLIWK